MTNELSKIINYFNANFATFSNDATINTYNNINLYELINIFFNDCILNNNFCKNLYSLHEYINYKTITVINYQKTMNNEYIIFKIDNDNLKFEFKNNNYAALLITNLDDKKITTEINIDKNIIKEYIDYIKVNYNKIQLYYYMKNKIIEGNFNGYLYFSIETIKPNNSKILNILYTNGSFTNNVDWNLDIPLTNNPNIKFTKIKINNNIFNINENESIKLLKSLYIDTNSIHSYIKNIHEDKMKPKDNIINLDEYRTRIKK